MKPARFITIDGRCYVSVEDIKAALKDDKFVSDCAEMLVVANERGDGPIEGLRRTIGHAIWSLLPKGRR